MLWNMIWILCDNFFLASHYVLGPNYMWIRVFWTKNLHKINILRYGSLTLPQFLRFQANPPCTSPSSEHLKNQQNSTNKKSCVLTPFNSCVFCFFVVSLRANKDAPTFWTKQICEKRWVVEVREEKCRKPAKVPTRVPWLLVTWFEVVEEEGRNFVFGKFFNDFFVMAKKLENLWIFLHISEFKFYRI